MIMLVKQKTGQYSLHPSLFSGLASAPVTLVFSQEGLPVSVPSHLLRLFSPTLLSPLLDLPPCITTSIIIPDTNLASLNTLIDLLKTGEAVQSSSSVSACVSTRVTSLAQRLGISLGNVSVTPGSSSLSSGATGGNIRISQVTGSSSFTATGSKKKTNKKTVLRRANTSTVDSGGDSNIVRNIKEEITTDGGQEGSSKFNCEVCHKHFNSASPLAFHYCKHYYKELQSLEFPDFIEDTKCNKCEKTFPDKKAMLCHIGVKHKLINQILALNGKATVPLGAQQETSGGQVTIKMEKQSHGPKTKSKTKAQSKTETTPRRGRVGKEIKEVRFCEICEKELENVSQLANHMISSHFRDDIKEMCKNMYNGKECTECNKAFNKNSVWQHLGSVHNKLDDVLMMKGFRPLKTIVTPKMRQVTVKKEREEDTSATETPDYGLPNLFESVLATSVEEESQDYGDEMMASDPLTT